MSTSPANIEGTLATEDTKHGHFYTYIILSDIRGHHYKKVLEKRGNWKVFDPLKRRDAFPVNFYVEEGEYVESVGRILSRMNIPSYIDGTFFFSWYSHSSELGDKGELLENLIRHKEELKIDYIPRTAHITFPGVVAHTKTIKKFFKDAKEQNQDKFIFKPTLGWGKKGVTTIKNRQEMLRWMLKYIYFPVWALQQLIESYDFTNTTIGAKLGTFRVETLWVVTHEPVKTIDLYNISHWICGINYQGMSITTCRVDGEISRGIQTSGESKKLTDVFDSKDSNKIIKQSDRIVRDVAWATLRHIKCKAGSVSCFNIVSFDMIIDTDKKVWLLEANINSTVNYDILRKDEMEKVTDEIVKIAIDPLFPPTNPQSPRDYNVIPKKLATIKR